MSFSSSCLHYSKFTSENFDLYLTLVSNPEVMKHISNEPLAIEKAKERFQKVLAINQQAAELGVYLVRKKTDQTFIGLAKVVGDSKGKAEIGYSILPAFWGQQYGTEIATCMVAKGQSNSSLHELTAITDPVNEPSNKILYRLGFEMHEKGLYEGMLAYYFRLKINAQAPTSMEQNSKVNIISPRLCLRNLQELDLADFLAYRQDREVCRFQGFDTFSDQEAIDFIADQKNIYLGKVGDWVQIGIEEKASNRLIGDCAIQFLAAEPRMVEIGYTINPKYQQRGFATEALAHLFNEVFSKHAVHKVIANVDVRNISSVKLLGKLGFVQEGLFRQNYFDPEDQKWTDEYRYGLLKVEFNMPRRS